MSWMWFLRKARQVADGGRRRRTMYFATVDFGTSIPILPSSPTILGAPQSGLADDILRMRSRTSRGIDGRPGLPERDSSLRYSRNFRRRQARTVSTCTKTRAARQPDQARASQDQRIQSAGFSRVESKSAGGHGVDAEAPGSCSAGKAGIGRSSGRRPRRRVRLEVSAQVPQDACPQVLER